MNKYIKVFLLINIIMAMITAGIVHLKSGSSSENRKPIESAQEISNETEEYTEVMTSEEETEPTMAIATTSEDETELTSEITTEFEEISEGSEVDSENGKAHKDGIFHRLKLWFDSLFKKLFGSKEVEESNADTDVSESESFQETEKKTEHSYEVFKADVSWSSAKALAEARNGYLAVINDKDEFEKICNLVEKTDSELKYIWLGGHADESGSYVWNNGDPFDFSPWFSGEPSYEDADGTVEDCLSMWIINGAWSFNDQRDDLNKLGSLVEGKIGYVIEYEE